MKDIYLKIGIVFSILQVIFFVYYAVTDNTVSWVNVYSVASLSIYWYVVAVAYKKGRL